MNDYKAVRLFDLMVLLLNIQKGARDKQVGFEDVNNTLRSLTASLNHEVAIKKDLIESALWSCNLLDEVERFEHPEGKSFKQFLNSMRVDKFDKRYNIIGD